MLKLAEEVTDAVEETTTKVATFDSVKDAWTALTTAGKTATVVIGVIAACAIVYGIYALCAGIFKKSHPYRRAR